MLTGIAGEALSKGVCLEIHYNGYTRTVEVHCVGVTTAGNPAMRVWQVRGGSVSNEPVGWKMLVFHEASGATLTEEPSAAPRNGYKRGDRGMQQIVSEI
jgi:hypothetical protein